MNTSLGIDLRDLDQLAQRPTALALDEIGPFLDVLVHDPTFLKTQIFSLVNQVLPTHDPHIAHTYISPAGGCSLQVFVWAPGVSTPIHDHTSWGAYYCVVGSLQEERYERIDNGTQHNYAQLRMIWRRRWQRADGVSTVAPYAEGIHRVTNTSYHRAISVHVYGPRMSSLDGRDYDPSRDYVCDRFDEIVMGHG